MRRLKVTRKPILKIACLKLATNELLKLSFSLSYLEKEIESSFLLCMIFYLQVGNATFCREPKSASRLVTVIPSRLRFFQKSVF